MATEQKNAKIDMRHGFMKSIIRNQVDRDNYEKEVKGRPNVKKGPFFNQQNQNRPKKPNQATYIPPPRLEHADETAQDQESSEEDDMPKTLFCFEFEDKDGKIYKQYVKEGVRAEVLAQRMGYDRRLTPAMTKALELRLQAEINKRTRKK